MTEVLLPGFHAVKHALRFAPELVDRVEAADLERLRALADRLAPDLRDELLTRAVVTPVEHHTGVQALARRPPEDRSVLGVHVLGTGATDLVHIGQAVMASGPGGLDFLVTAVFNYPTFAESYKVAALDADNRIKAMKSFGE